MNSSIILLYFSFGFFIFEFVRLSLLHRKSNTNLFLLVPFLASSWILSIIMLNSSATIERALNWYRLSYAILLPVPMITHWNCYKMIRLEVPKYVPFISIPISAVLLVLTFASSLVIPGVSINPFIPKFGPLYSGLTLLALFHVGHGYFVARRSKVDTVIVDREIEFANNFISHLMIPLTFAAIIGGFVSPWLITHGLLSKNFSFLFVSIGLGVTFTYYILSRYIFWRIDSGGHDIWAERLLQKITTQLSHLLLSKQVFFRKSINAFFASLAANTPIETILEKFSELSTCKLLLEFKDEPLRNYGTAVELLSLYLSEGEWERSKPLITSKLKKENQSLFQKLSGQRLGAIFPVRDEHGMSIGSLKFDLHFSHRFFHPQDFVLIERLCDILALQYHTQFSNSPPHGLRPYLSSQLIRSSQMTEHPFSWLHWVKRCDIPILGKTIYLYGDPTWKQRVAQALKHSFATKSVEKKVRREQLEEEGSFFLAEHDVSAFNLEHKFHFHNAVLPQGLDDTALVDFCVQSLLVKEGLVHASTRSDACILSLSPELHKLKEDLSRLSKRMDPPPLFLGGPTGVGKNLFVSAFYEKSERTGPLVSVNCAAIPDTLLESELFGHRKGAFTGANSDKKGLFEEAQGGILFLDEIGDMPQGLQAKLLHVLQERKIQPVGSNTKIDLDIWIASASKYSPQEMKHRLRDDLFFRLMGISRTLPSLEERPLDIPLLIAYCFLYDAYYTQNYWSTSVEWMEEKLAGRWPGNARELVHRLRSEMALAPSPYCLDLASSQKADIGEVSTALLSRAPNASKELAEIAGDLYLKKPYKLFKRQLVVEHSRLYFKTLLEKTPNQQEAAKLAGISPSRLSTILKELNM